MGISEDHFLALRQLLHRHTAMNLALDKRYLAEARLQKLARQHTEGDLNALIEKACEGGVTLQHQVAEAMAIHETYFFRDPLFREAFEQTILPVLGKRRAEEKVLRIWSAACSSGQEAYSIAILLDEVFPFLQDWRIQILGSDFSNAVLEKASQGRYAIAEINRGLPARTMLQYFQQQGLEWQAKPALRERIEFQRINLAGDWPDLPLFDVVLLRNVLIYFSQEQRQRLLQRIRTHMRRDGYLLLGGSESLEQHQGFVPALPGSHKPLYQPD